MIDNQKDILIKLQRHSTRLKGYDYSSPGAYFVTVVTYQRLCVFGEMVNGEIKLSQFGQIVTQTWEWLSAQYPYVELGSHVVMPNHFHGILQIRELDNNCRGGSRPAPTQAKTLGQLIGAFKTVSAKHINQIRHSPGLPLWQRGFFEHIIRNNNEYEGIWNYIDANPINWLDDKLKPYQDNAN